MIQDAQNPATASALRWCSRGRHYLPPSEFTALKRVWCKACSREHSKQYRAANRDKLIAKAREKRAARRAIGANNRTADLTGREFGELRVLKLAERINTRRIWLCACSCGKERTSSTYQLLSGAHEDCADCARARLRARAHDLTGRMFGRLRVIGSAGYASRARWWRCLCACGRTRDCRQHKLLNGRDTACCACTRREASEKAALTIRLKLKDYAGHWKDWYERFTPEMKAKYRRLIARRRAHMKITPEIRAEAVEVVMLEWHEAARDAIRRGLPVPPGVRGNPYTKRAKERAQMIQRELELAA